MNSTVNAKTDTDLALLWKSGDVTAFNELVRRHLDPILRFIRAKCGNEHDASDICQEVFLDVCMKISNYNPEHPFAAWLYTIARCKTIDKQRRTRSLDMFDADRHSGTDFREPSALLQEKESATEAWCRVFHLLPDNQANALWLKVQAQQSIEQIAATMNQSEANVKILLFRARQRLAKEWHPKKPTIESP